LVTSTRVDLEGLLEASRALSSETDIGHLLIRMMKLVMTNSGATEAVLLLRRGQNWIVQAEADTTTEQHARLLDLPYRPSDDGRTYVPVSVFETCRRTQQTLVVEDASGDERFAVDTAVGSGPVRSLACLPVMHQGKLLAMLYLEHRQLAAVFTPDRIEVLGHLSAQLGVSLDNVRLYDDLKHRLGELQASEERYALAVSGSAAGLWDWDVAVGRIFYSERFQELLGHAPGDFTDTLDEFWGRLHPEDAVEVRAAVDRHLADREPYSVDYRMRRADGGFRWFHARGQASWSESGEPVRMSGSISDITVRKVAEEELAKSESYFRSLLEQFPLATEILALDGRITRVNSAWRHLWDVDEAEAEQALATYNMLTDSQLKDQGLQEDVRAAFAGQAVVLKSFQYDGMRAVDEFGMGDMTVTAPWVQSHLSPLKDADGETQFILNTYVDVTALHQAEEESRQHQEALARVDRASSLGQLAGSIAHELNQPLTGILSNSQAVELMIEGGLDDPGELREVMAEIVADTKRAGEVIHNMRDLYRKQTGDVRTVDLNTIIEETTRLLRGEVVVRRVELMTELDPLALKVFGNKIQLQQVVVNLVMNAIQAVQGLDRNLRRVRIAAAPRGPEVAVWVEDRGLGIDPDKIDRIFEPLVTWKPGGTGMGLTISNAIIEAHAGHMWAENRAGGGARVGFTLPVLEEGESS
jgi:PAS domain S-box-containing protein